MMPLIPMTERIDNPRGLQDIGTITGSSGKILGKIFFPDTGWFLPEIPEQRAIGFHPLDERALYITLDPIRV